MSRVSMDSAGILSFFFLSSFGARQGNKIKKKSMDKSNMKCLMLLFCFFFLFVCVVHQQRYL